MKNLISSVAIFISFCSFGQTIQPSLVNSASGSFSQSTSGLNFTLGELVVMKMVGPNGNSLGGGFPPSAVISTVSVEEIDSNNLDISIFPNPTEKYLNIKVNHSTFKEISVVIQDNAGKLCLSDRFIPFNNLITLSLNELSEGMYFLVLMDNATNIIGRFKFNIIPQK